MTYLPNSEPSPAEAATTAALATDRLVTEIEELVRVFDRVGDVPHALRAASILARHRFTTRDVEYTRIVGHLPFQGAA